MTHETENSQTKLVKQEMIASRNDIEMLNQNDIKLDL